MLVTKRKSLLFYQFYSLRGLDQPMGVKNISIIILFVFFCLFASVFNFLVHLLGRTIVSASCAGTMYFVSQYISLEVQETIVICAAVVGISSAMVLDRFVWRLSPPSNINK